MIFVDSHELRAFGADLGRLSAKSTGAMFTVFRTAGEDLKREWVKNATETAGKHGKRYPKSITADVKLSTDIVVEIGPDPRLPQGGMSFEFGSVNQPPHLDGQKAMDAEIPKLEAAITSALDKLLGGL